MRLANIKEWPRAATHAGATVAAFSWHCVTRFIGDGCLTSAGALSYTTLVSLVPLMAIAIAVLSAFPVFADMRDRLLSSLFDNFVPQVGAEVEWWFRYFAGTSVRTTSIGIIALAVTVLLLLGTIEDQLHHIWRVKSPRPWVQRILAYWAVLTLGPLLIGAAFSLPSYVDLAVQHSGWQVDTNRLWQDPLTRRAVTVLPFLLEAITFALIYALIPNCSVRWREAAVGAIVAAALVEGLKTGFTLYIAYLSSYRAVYGALAAIPIFLLWMYVAWSIVLFGAVVAAELPRWRADEHATALPAAYRLGLALSLLAELAAQSWRGGTLAIEVLAERLGVSTSAVDDTLSLMRRGGFVAAAEGGWVLARSLEGATLAELYAVLDLPLAASLEGEPIYPWQRRIAPAIRRIAMAESEALAVPLRDLVAPIAPFPGPRRRHRS